MKLKPSSDVPQWTCTEPIDWIERSRWKHLGCKIKIILMNKERLIATSYLRIYFLQWIAFFKYLSTKKVLVKCWWELQVVYLNTLASFLCMNFCVEKSFFALKVAKFFEHVGHHQGSATSPGSVENFCKYFDGSLRQIMTYNISFAK